jgi:acyl-CoA dehydrogenase
VSGAPISVGRWELNHDERALQRLARRFTEREIVPQRARLDATGEFPLEILRKAFDAGLLSAWVPEAHGGAGLGLFAVCLMAEELGAGCPGVGTSLMVNYLGTGPLVLFATVEQKSRYLDEYCRRLTLVSFACTEPEAGSDLGGIRTRYRRDGDRFVIDGSKQFITNAGYADYFVTVARREGGRRGLGGLSLFVVPKATPGVSVGKPIEKMGQRCSNTAPVFFEGVTVPSDSLVGGEGEGIRLVYASVLRSRLAIASAAVGLGRAALEHAFQYARKRRQFEQPLADFQAVQLQIAELWARLEAARSLVRVTARRYDLGHEVAKEICAAKDHASRVAMDTTSSCLELLGGYGYTKDHPLEKMMRDAKLFQIYEGTSTMQKLTVFQQLLRQGTVVDEASGGEE